MVPTQAPTTTLRRRLEHSMALDVEGQLRECVEYLENPDILMAEFSDSLLTAQEFDHREESFLAAGQAEASHRCWGDRVVQRLIDRERVHVALDPPSVFRYLAREIVPFWSEQAAAGEDVPLRDGGLDYVGITEETEPRPVLGVVKRQAELTPYLPFLRLLTCLAEVASEPQLERANRFLFKGELASRPEFDLHVIAVEWHPDHEPHALVQLTHDLAHQFGILIKDEWALPNLIQSVAFLSFAADDPSLPLSPIWVA